MDQDTLARPKDPKLGHISEFRHVSTLKRGPKIQHQQSKLLSDGVLRWCRAFGRLGVRFLDRWTGGPVDPGRTSQVRAR